MTATKKFAAHVNGHADVGVGRGAHAVPAQAPANPLKIFQHFADAETKKASQTGFGEAAWRRRIIGSALAEACK